MNQTCPKCENLHNLRTSEKLQKVMLYPWHGGTIGILACTEHRDEVTDILDSRKHYEARQ